jgi:nucleoid DNA-binding protein
MEGLSMTKQDLVDRLSSEIGMPKLEVQTVVDGLLSLVMDSVSSGQRVELRRFGVWKPVIRKGRKVRTPDGIREIDVPDRSTVVFVPSIEFRSRLSDLKFETSVPERGLQKITS